MQRRGHVLALQGIPLSEGPPGRWDWLAAGVDRAAHGFALSRSRRSRRRSRAESLGPAERAAALTSLRERYGHRLFIDEPESFFPTPAAPEVRGARVRGLRGGGQVTDLSWPSNYRPFASDVAERYSAFERNGTVVARLFQRGDRPRPAVILIHGYLGGHHAIEERTWPIPWFLRRGLDAALFVLPLHASRSDGGRPKFPSSDPRLTIEGFRQAVHDLRALIGHLRAAGAPDVGVIGMSLGAYTCALLATVEARLSFAVPFVPLASIADFAAEGERFVGTPAEREQQHRLLDAVFEVVSPLARPPLVPPAGRLVVAGRSDRITPAGHARRLAAHFEAPLTFFPGGHLIQLGRSEGFRAVGRMLGALDLLEP